MEARKLNKVYDIDKSQADAYAAQGYEIAVGALLVDELVMGAALRDAPVFKHDNLVG